MSDVCSNVVGTLLCVANGHIVYEIASYTTVDYYTLVTHERMHYAQRVYIRPHNGGVHRNIHRTAI